MSVGDFVKWQQGVPGDCYECQGQIIEIVRGDPIGQFFVVASNGEEVIVFPEQIVSELETGI